MSQLIKTPGRRKVIFIARQLGIPTRRERAQTKGCWDLREYAPPSEVRIIRPAAKPAI